MAAALAKEFTACSFCDESMTKVSLYVCVVDDCPKFGEVYCEICGTMAHKKQDHSFDGTNVKTVGINNMSKSMEVMLCFIFFVHTFSVYLH